MIGEAFLEGSVVLSKRIFFCGWSRYCWIQSSRNYPRTLCPLASRSWFRRMGDDASSSVVISVLHQSPAKTALPRPGGRTKWKGTGGRWKDSLRLRFESFLPPPASRIQTERTVNAGPTSLLTRCAEELPPSPRLRRTSRRADASRYVDRDLPW